MKNLMIVALIGAVFAAVPAQARDKGPKPHTPNLGCVLFPNSLRCLSGH